MIHLTLNTGHARNSPRDEVDLAVLELLRPLCRPGRHPLPGPPGYQLAVSVEGRALIATVYAGTRPVVTTAVACDGEASESLWEALRASFDGRFGVDFARLTRPESVPWCAALVAAPTPSEAGWCGDLERCLAWAWVGECAAGRA